MVPPAGAPGEPPPQRGPGGWWMPHAGQWHWVPDPMPPAAPLARHSPSPNKRKVLKIVGGIWGGLVVLVLIGAIADASNDGKPDSSARAASSKPAASKAPKMDSLERAKAEGEARSKKAAADLEASYQALKAKQDAERAAKEAARRAGPEDVIDQCRDWAKGKLKSPASAKFPDDATAAEGPKDQWLVRGSVDSQNSFGAMLRSRYECIVMFDFATKMLTSEHVQITEG